MAVFDQGGFSQISIDPEDETIIVKKFLHMEKNGTFTVQPWDLNFLVHEAMITLYFKESPYIVNICGINLNESIIKTQRWDCSLRMAYSFATWTEKEKFSIFRDILYALSHMQSRGIIHADIKSSNILYDSVEKSACVCDLGLSSIGKYAKFAFRCFEYSSASDPDHKNRESVVGRDMFALCVTMSEFFCGIKPEHKKQRTSSELRNLITESQGLNKTIRDGLLMMIPDDMSKAPTAVEVLKFVFGETKQLPLPKIVTHKNTIIEKADLEWIKERIMSFAQRYAIKRGNRCFNALVSFINKPREQKIEAKDYDVYIAAALFIYSSLFDMPKLYFNRAFSFISSGASKETFTKVVTIMMTDREFIDFTLNPESK